MPMPEPGTKEYEKMVDFMRADLDSNMGLTKIIEGARKWFASEGRDFDGEFEEYRKQQKGGDIGHGKERDS